jgi:hypothetical protein
MIAFHDVRHPVVRVLGAERRVVRELESRRHPGDRWQRRGLDVAEQVVDRPDVLVPVLLVLVHVLDRGVGLPDVAGLVRVGGVEGPVDVAARELLADRVEGEAGGVLGHVALAVEHRHVDVLAVRVAAPALEDSAVVQALRENVLRVVDRAARLTGDEEQVVRVRGAGLRGEHVVAEHEVLRPSVVVRDVRPRELRVGVVRAVLADREPVLAPPW